ncbi:Disease resistance protein RPV1 [Linum grandiflorum]
MSNRRRRRRRDVFVSFRGRDVRYKFVDHLFSAFQRKKVKAFRDADEENPSKTIEEGIRRAIDNSDFYVVVLTENYASSPWCLDELVMIMDKSRGGEMVFPVFYHVSPDDVSGRGIKGRYTCERVKRWVEALDWIVRIDGWVVTTRWVVGGEYCPNLASMEAAVTNNLRMSIITVTKGIRLNPTQSNRVKPKLYRQMKLRT